MQCFYCGSNAEFELIQYNPDGFVMDCIHVCERCKQEFMEWQDSIGLGPSYHSYSMNGE